MNVRSYYNHIITIAKLYNHYYNHSYYYLLVSYILYSHPYIGI